MGEVEKAEENSNLWGHHQHIEACLINAHRPAEVPSHPAASTRPRTRADFLPYKADVAAFARSTAELHPPLFAAQLCRRARSIRVF